MQLNFDFSVVSECGAACGVVNGSLEMSHIPRVGEMVCFGQPSAASKIAYPAGVNTLLTVENVIHAPIDGGSRVSICLANLIIPSINHTQDVFQYFERGFGLSYDPFLEKDF